MPPVDGVGTSRSDAVVNEWTGRILHAAVEVHKALGPGYAEQLYENALAREFDVAGLPYSRQHCFHMKYKGAVVGEGRLDFLVADMVVVELKAVEQMSKLFTSQVISYLKATSCPIALLLNFNVPVLTDGIRRIRL